MQHPPAAECGGGGGGVLARRAAATARGFRRRLLEAAIRRADTEETWLIRKHAKSFTNYFLFENVSFSFVDSLDGGGTKSPKTKHPLQITRYKIIRPEITQKTKSPTPKSPKEQNHPKRSNHPRLRSALWGKCLRLSPQVEPEIVFGQPSFTRTKGCQPIVSQLRQFLPLLSLYYVTWR